ncbi:MAG: cobalt transporter [Alphaproteobacteria bacterium]|nr:cobalt transporter [Alphaproteobacteria bacterium]
MFRRIFFAAVLGGLVAGGIASAVQAVRAVPLILQAEVFEEAAGKAKPHDHAASATHDHDEDAWAPADGWERTGYTLLFNLLAGIGFGLLISAGLALSGEGGWKTGLAWGVCGYLSFVVAPALGLPPELPGTEAAPLVSRQLWWTATAAATAAGLALILIRRGAIGIVLGLALLALPHLVGAPHPAEQGGAAPPGLVREFIIAALVSGLVFWLALGASTGAIYRRLAAA